MRFSTAIIVAFFFTVPIRVLMAAPPEKYVLQSEMTRKSPHGKFLIKHYGWERGDGDWDWQTWIVPVGKSTEAYPLPHSPRYPPNREAECFVSSDEKFIVYIQTTGSGDISGDLYARGRSGRYELTDARSTFDTDAWEAFDARSHFTTDAWKCRYHEAIGFLGWEPDGETFAFRLGGQHCSEDYYVHDWRMHYNVRTRKFFLTADEQTHNRRALHWKNWRRPRDAAHLRRREWSAAARLDFRAKIAFDSRQRQWISASRAIGEPHGAEQPG